MRSELIDGRHLARRAVIYIRQSTPHQVLTNQESLRLQYDLRRRALDLGWREEDIEVIDSDLGLSGAAAAHRAGFKDLIARVTLGQVGIVLSSEVTRLSRNCTDWYPLLDLCGYRQCLIGDRDGVYDPASANGRLLLGLKGTISEMELHTIRARLTAGLLNKAERGELGLILPVGLVRDAAGLVVKNPDREVQARLELVFAPFLRRRSAAKVLRSLNEGGLALPRRGRLGDVLWRPPTVAAVLSVLKNPAYARAFVYGRTRSIRDAVAATPRPKKLPREQWRIVVRDKYPAYVSWETFEKIQAMLRDNYAEYDRNKTRGIPRDGEALLHGLVYCGACGHKMVVQYKGGTRYLCNYLRQQHGTPVCQSIPAGPIDAAAVDAFFQALRPARPGRSSRGGGPPGGAGGAGPGRPGVRGTRRCCAPRRSRSSGCATGRRWPNGNTTRSIRTTVWSRPNWNAVGKRRCAICARPRRRWTRRVRESAKPPFRSTTGYGRPSPTPVGAFPSYGTAGPDDGAQEGAAALPDRQARDPPQRAGHHPHAPGLAGRRRQRARHPRGGRLARRAVAARGAGGAPPRTRARGPGRRGDRRRADRGRTPLADARPRAAEHGAEHPPAARDPADAKPVAPAPGTRAPQHLAACDPARGQRLLVLRPRPQRHHRDHSR